MSHSSNEHRCPTCNRRFTAVDGDESSLCPECASKPVLKRRGWKQAVTEDESLKDQKEQRSKAHQLPIYACEQLHSQKVSIVEFLPLISARRAYGLSAIKDFALSIRDVFGGRSKTLETALETIEAELIRELSQQAVKFGADAIIGFQIQFGDVSGVSGVMLYATARGTPVRLQAIEEY